MVCELNDILVFKERVKIILASESPRRKELLKQTGLIFQSISVGVEPEPFLNEDPEKYAIRAAKAKAMAVACLYPEACIIGADTIVIYQGEHESKIIGKPRSEEDSLSVLESFQGGQHQILTACCIVWPKTLTKDMAYCEVWTDNAIVFFGQWPKPVLQAYIRTGEPQDKAGSCSIEGIGGLLINRIEGNLMTALGLPLSELIKRLIQGEAIYVDF